jgi:GNAT superfamily N-acetyltransferase
MAANTDTTTRTRVVPRRSTAADLPVLTSTIADAFHDDPTMRWIVPDEERRRALGPAMFRPLVEGIQRLGASWLTDDGAGAALWIPPGHVVPAPEEAEAFEQAVAEVLAPAELERLGALIAVMDANLPTEPHAHLNLLGTRPSRQGEGIGSALLDAVLPRFDEEGVAAYLEATTDRNRRLYERHGFVHWNDIRPAGGPPLRRMWRAPGAGR